MFWSVEVGQLCGRHSDLSLIYLPAAPVGPQRLKASFVGEGHIYVRLFVALSKATYAENSHIVFFPPLSSRY